MAGVSAPATAFACRYTSLASSTISVLLAKSFEMGQPALASAAALSKTSFDAPGTLAVVVSAMRVMAKPPSTLASVTAAWVSIFRSQPSAAQLRAQRHGEATGVSRRNQFLGVVPELAPSNRVANE